MIQDYALTGVKSMPTAVNGFFDWLDRPECKAKPLKIQGAIFARPEKELTKAEYDRLVRTALNKYNEGR